jgi:uncharacterized SAM-binding protein YcdF (DUF218 family)
MKKTIRILLISGVCIIICTMSLFSTLFLKNYASRQFSQAERKKPYDVIIIPGFPFDSIRGKWDTLMKSRVYWSYYLYKRGIASNIIYSGSSVYTPYIESKIMAMYGKAIGIPDNHIFTEEQAEHSTENIYYSYQLAQKMGFQKIAIATDPLQSLLLISFCKKKGFHLISYPLYRIHF